MASHDGILQVSVIGFVVRIEQGKVPPWRQLKQGVSAGYFPVLKSPTGSWLALSKTGEPEWRRL